MHACMYEPSVCLLLYFVPCNSCKRIVDEVEPCYILISYVPFGLVITESVTAIHMY